jgi:hypothetical protein
LRITRACSTRSRRAPNTKLVLHIGGNTASRVRLRGASSSTAAISTTRSGGGSFWKKRRADLSVSEVLDLALQAGAPVVYDNLLTRSTRGHGKKRRVLDRRVRQKWHVADGAQKVHYSQQHPRKPAARIPKRSRSTVFWTFITDAGRKTGYHAGSSKDKNRSALKCILCASPHPVSRWRRSGRGLIYAVLERSPSDMHKFARC